MGVAKMEKKIVCVLISRLLAARKGIHCKDAAARKWCFFRVPTRWAFVISLQIRFFIAVHRIGRVQMFFSSEKLE